MGADLSRIRHSPLLDIAGVELKQGGVLLDADFNELVAVVDRRLRAAASDILGRSTVSSTTPDAFTITPVSGGLEIGKGRLYVDGLLAENHGAVPTDPAKKRFDPLMAEVTFADKIAYAAQPYLPNAPALPKRGTHLVYLDVWQRELTHLERPELVETAVGVETSSRLQTAWQVRVLGDDAGRATCASPDDDVAGWSDLIAPSSGRLTTGTFDVPPSSDPCELPPTGGYRGLENQTYRVEIQDPGMPGGTATFKWSRDNACVGSRVASMVSDTELELQTLGRDDVLRFNAGDWVEIIDDVRELSQRCGEIRQITTVNESARRITFASELHAEMLPVPPTFPNSDFPLTRNLRVRRWDQKGKVLRTGTGPGGTTPQFQDLDEVGSSGVIKVPPDGTTLLLENGVTVGFTTEGAGTKGFRRGDYWVFAARTADASVELLDNAPPRGIHHHYARLAIWDAGAGAAGAVTDCRTPWPPRGEGHDCSCTECVTPESHLNKALTIQDAVNRIGLTGGTVCLGVGQYQLKEPVRLVGAHSVRIKGEGAATVIVTPGGAFSISNGVALAIEDLAILSLGLGSAISVRTALGLSLQRLIIAVLGTNDAKGAAIALSGAVIGATIRDNAIIAPVAVQAADPAARTAAGARVPQMLLSAMLRIEDNTMWCERQAVALTDTVLHLMATRITGNEILGCRSGAITVLGLCGPGASMKVCDNSLNVNGPGITAGVDGLWIEGNKLLASTPRDSRVLNGSGVALRTGLDPNGANECQILANQIRGFEDAGILIASPTGELIVKLNIIQHCGNGIISQDEAQAASVSIENNHVSDIGSARAGAPPEVVGIGVLRAVAATVAGNTVRRVGQQAAQDLCAGVAASGVQRLRVSGNDVMDIGPPGRFENGLGVGVLLRAPYSQAEVSHNQVDRESQPLFQGGGRFMALLVDEPPGVGAVSRIGAYAALQVDATTTLVLGATRPFVNHTAGLAANVASAAAPPARGANASVLGNTLAARGDLPAVRLAASGDCLFSDNRCELRGVGTKVAVELTGGATIVNANRVRGGEVSVLIHGNTEKATVLGNITTGKIDLGDELPARWKDLNVQG